MRADKIKGFVCGVLTTALVAGGTAIAAGQWKTIEVLENDITVMVDGKQVSEDNFVYNDRTYLPLRAVAEAVGKPVEYDANTNTAYIGNKTGGQTMPITTPASKFDISYDKGPKTVKYIEYTINVDSFEINSAEESVGKLKLTYTIIGSVDYDYIRFDIRCYDKDGFEVHTIPFGESVSKGAKAKITKTSYIPLDTVRLEIQGQ